MNVDLYLTITEPNTIHLTNTYLYQLYVFHSFICEGNSGEQNRHVIALEVYDVMKEANKNNKLW